MSSWPGRVHESDQVTAWIANLSEKDRREVRYLLNALATLGPSLGRPLVGKIKDKSLGKLSMLELRGQNPFVRILYVFDRNRDAILLYGGDKSDDSKWKGWYHDAIAQALHTYNDRQADATPAKGRSR